MIAALTGIAGDLTGKRIALGDKPITFGRGDENDVVLTTPSASRVHAEVRLQRLTQTRDRLASRLDGLPDDEMLRAHLQAMPGPLVHTLLVSDSWDTVNVGGEEVDVDWLLDPPRPARSEQRRPADQVTALPSR